MPVIDTAALEAAARYLKLRNLAESATGAEKAEIRKQLARMEEKDPELRERAERVAGALLPPPPPWERAPDAAPEPRAPSNKWGDGIASLFRHAAESTADRIAEEMTGKHRFERLRSMEIDCEPLTCGAGQVCFEVRARKADLRKSSSRAEIMEAIELKLRHAAME